jgi:hypothetical protein
MTPDQIIAVVTALLSSSPDPTAFTAIKSGGADPRYPVTVEACPANAVPPTEVEGSTVICGRVTVPEDHDKPDGTRIDLAFAVLKARTQTEMGAAARLRRRVRRDGGPVSRSGVHQRRGHKSGQSG